MIKVKVAFEIGEEYILDLINSASRYARMNELWKKKVIINIKIIVHDSHPNCPLIGCCIYTSKIKSNVWPPLP